MRFTVRVPSAEIRARLNKAKVAINTRQRELLEAIGVRVLSFSKLDYVTKSRGGTGTDGIKWKPLAESTIKARNRRGTPTSKRKRTKGGKLRPGRGGSVAIGIDSGLQLNSATPGYSDSGRSEPPKRTAGKNILVVTDKDVTVGFGRTYSKYYDAERALLPETLPKKWEEVISGIVQRWAQKLLKDATSG